MLRVPLVASTGRAGYWLERLVALVVVAVAHRKDWHQLLGHWVVLLVLPLATALWCARRA